METLLCVISGTRTSRIIFVNGHTGIHTSSYTRRRCLEMCEPGRGKAEQNKRQDVEAYAEQ